MAVSKTAVAASVYVATLPFLGPGVGLGVKQVVLADVAFVVLVLVLVLEGRWRRLQRHACVFALPAAAVVASAFRAGLPGQGSLEVTRIVYSGLVFATIAVVARDPGDRRLVRSAWLATSATLATIALAVWAGAHVGLWPGGAIAPAGSAGLPGVRRVAGPMHPNAFALYLTLSLALSMSLHATPGTAVRAAALLATCSRTIASAAVAVVLVARPRRRVVVAGAGLLLIGTIVVTILAVFPVRWADGRPVINTTPNAYLRTHQASWRAWRENPFLGVGPVAAGEMYVRYTTASERADTWPRFERLAPHSFWLGTAGRFGLLGLLGWLTTLTVVARGSRSRRHLAGVAALVLTGLHMDWEHLKFVWAFLALEWRPHTPVLSVGRP